MSTLAGAYGFDANGSPTTERPENWNVSGASFSACPAYLKAMRLIEDEPEFTTEETA